MLFGQRISLLTPPEVVIFQVLEFFHYSPLRGISVVRTKNFFTHPPRGSNFSGFRIFSLLTPLEVVDLSDHKTQVNKIIVWTYIAF